MYLTGTDLKPCDFLDADEIKEDNGMRHYTVAYRMCKNEVERKIEVDAMTKYVAWKTAWNEKIPEKEGGMPYSAWVDSVTYKNGVTYIFNTCDGKAY